MSIMSIPTRGYVREIPPMEAFYDSLHDRQSATANYEFAKKN